MNGIEKNRLTENLEKIREQRCAYGGGSICDCKYGKKGETPRIMGEAFSGCPEITMAKKIIEKMTEKEFERLCKRANITITL